MKLRYTLQVVIVALLASFLWLQYILWFSSSGFFSMWRLHQKLTQMMLNNQQLHRNNELLHNDVQDLQRGSLAVEDHARRDLGMVKSGETFYQVIDSKEGITDDKG